MRQAGTCEGLENRRLLCGLSFDHLIAPPVWSEAIEQQFVSEHRSGPEDSPPPSVGIIWVNRGSPTDNFTNTFGTSANAARAVVDAAISHWQRVISSWNRADGSTTLQVNISISGSGFGGAGAPNATAPADGKPVAGSFTLGGGTSNGDPNDSNGWYFDPTPNDWSEYNVPIDAFSGSSTTATGSDFYSAAVLELTHVLGLVSEKNNTGSGSWSGYLMATTSYATNTNIRDNTEGGGNFGRFWAFDGPTVKHLMTSYNSGDATSESWGNIVHSAGQGANINWNIINWQTGGEDAGNALFDSGERNLPSWVMAHVLGDTYGYSINDPALYGSMYVNQSANGQVIVRGGAANATNVFNIYSFNILGQDYITIEADIGNDTPGSRHLPGAGDLPPWSTTLLASTVSSIVVNCGNGGDFVRIDGNAGKPVTVNGGSGDDTIDFALNGRNLSAITGNVAVNGGGGFNRIFAYDDNQTAAQTFTLNTVRFDRAGWGGFSYDANIDLLTLTTGRGNDTVNVQSTFAGEPVVLNSAAGNDIVNIGNTSNGVQSINADVQVNNTPAYSTVNISDVPDATARTITIDDWGNGYSAIAGVAPAFITWKNADTNTINITTGNGGDTVNVLRCTKPINLINNAGPDVVNVGNSSQGVQGIIADLTVSANSWWTTLNISDAGDGTARSMNIDWNGISAWGRVNNLSPAHIIWQTSGVAAVNLTTGNSADTVLVYSLTIPLYLNSVGGADIVNVGDTVVQGLQYIWSPIIVRNSANYTTLQIWDGADNVGRAWVIDDASGYGQLTGMAAGAISWNDNDITAIGLQCGSGVDSGSVLRLSQTLNIGNTGGLDQIAIGNPSVGGAQSITQGRAGGITITNPPSYTDIVIDDRGDSGSRTGTLDFDGTYNNLTGFAPATIRYSASDTRNVAIITGNGSNTLNVLRSTINNSTGLMHITSFGTDTINLGNSTNGMQSILVPIDLSSPSGADALVLDDRADATARTVAMAPTNPWNVITGIAPKTIRFDPNDAWSEVRFLGGSGANSFTFNGAGPLRLDPGGAASTLTVGSTALTSVGLIPQVPRLASASVFGGSQISLMGPTNQVFVVQSLFVAASAKLDMRDKAMILDYNGGSQLPTVESQIRSARNGGSWNGFGITSTSAAGNPSHNTTLGAIEATTFKSVYGPAAPFYGQTIDNTAVLVKYTYYGDTDFNGKVDGADYARIDAKFGQQGGGNIGGWFNGDLDYNGKIDGADYALIDAAFGSQGAVLRLPGGTTSGSLVR